MAEQHPLKQFRDDNELSQSALGAAVGVDEMTVSRWERGESQPRRGIWPQLEKVTSLPIGEILAGCAAAAANRNTEPAA